jgi:1-acyl-sn-glycerol-3-phosphate acyltransferase
MISSLILFVRSCLFYFGYLFFTIAMSAMFILMYPLLPDRGRHIFAVTWCTTVLNWLRLTCGVKYTVNGTDNIPLSPVVFISNHQSSWETILFYKLAFPIAPILKKELLNIPFWGWSMRLQKPIAIDRSRPREAGKSLLTQGVNRIQQGISVIVFPEGSRSKAGVVRRFSRGGAKLAIAANAPIIPIAHNAGYFWPPRQFLKRPGTIHVEIGEPIGIDNKNANELTEQVEGWIRQRVVLQ